jgi:hypothetical protein
VLRPALAAGAEELLERMNFDEAYAGEAEPMVQAGMLECTLLLRGNSGVIGGIFDTLSVLERGEQF